LVISNQLQVLSAKLRISFFSQGTCVPLANTEFLHKISPFKTFIGRSLAQAAASAGISTWLAKCAPAAYPMLTPEFQ